MYRVTIDGTYSGTRFDFANYDDALNFVSMVIEYGTTNGGCDENGNDIRKPMSATVQGVEE